MSTYLVCFAVSDFIFKEAVHTRADGSTVLVSTVYILIDIIRFNIFSVNYQLAF